MVCVVTPSRGWLWAPERRIGTVVTDYDGAGIAFVGPIGGDWVATPGWTGTTTRFWRSADGLRWEQAGVIEQAPPTNPVLAPAGGRLFYSNTGTEVPVGQPGGWTSIDGSTWFRSGRTVSSRHSVHALTQTDATYETITDIGAGEDGFVAVGVTGVPNGESTYFALASGDGRGSSGQRRPRNAPARTPPRPRSRASKSAQREPVRR